MKTLILVLLLNTAWAQQEPKQQTFLVVYKPGPAYVTGKPLSEQQLGEHGNYLLSLHSKGILKIAGPFTDDAGGAIMFSARNLDDAKDIVMKDPAIVRSIFMFELHPWGVVDWDARSKK